MLSKEELRQKRKEAYQKAKAKRDADPKYQALKEQVKAKRKAKYQAFKVEQKSKKQETKDKKQAQKDAALMVLMFPASQLED